jgi:ribosome-associated protein
MNADAGGDLLVAGRYRIPDSELEWTFTTSGGPGGQHANRSQTRAELRFDLVSSTAFPDPVKERMIVKLEKRMVGGVLSVASDQERSQLRNRQAARRRLADLLAASMVIPKRRRPTRPTEASRRRRQEEKRARSQLKRLRKPPQPG